MRGVVTAVLVAVLLAGCASHRGPVSHGLAPPGPAGDPWGPYIREASGRFGVPERWVRAVMQQESGGRQFIDGQQTTSAAGAMGLMQIVPGTYAELRQRYGLGGDPYDPHDNIMAGTAYIRELYDRFGAPGFLAAYNAGPGRLQESLDSGRRLPAETEAYVASVAPRLGGETPLTGPLAAYAAQPARERPSLPEPAPPPVLTAAPVAVVTIAPPAPPLRPVTEPGGWAIQVGAFNTPSLAREAADGARARGAGGETFVGVATRPDGGVLFRARVTGLSADSARAACARESASGAPCIVVPPDRAARADTRMPTDAPYDAS